MEDKGAYVFFDKFKWIFIIIIFIALVLIGIYFFGKIKNENNLKNYLNENGYKYEGQTYYKTSNENDGQTTYTINYIFSIKANNFTKVIDSSSNQAKENIQLKYNGTKIINIFYYTESYSDGSISSISQSAEYNMNNGEYKCELENINGDIKSQCPKIKKEAELFSDEVKKMLDEANINELFTTKNSDDI